MEACRLCEASPESCEFKHIFDKKQVNHDNLAEVILVMTGVKVQPTDVVSQKVCSRCCNIVQKMYKYRQDAQKQDMALKEKYDQLLTKGIKLPNTNVIIKRESSGRTTSRSNIASTSKETANGKLQKDDFDNARGKSNKNVKSKGKGLSKIHPSISKIFRENPSLKLPKRSFNMNLTPTVSLKMGEVENYFKKQKIDIKGYIWQPQGLSKTARKKTTQSIENSESSDTKTVAPIKITKIVLDRHDANQAAVMRKSINDLDKGKKRKRSLSVTSTSTSISHSSLLDSHSEVSSSREIREKTPDQTITNKNESSTPGTPGSLLVVRNETKSQPIFLCDLCGSVHNSNGMLRIHLAKRHMVCQFCKKRFKTLEAKEEHIQSDCPVKEMMNSAGPTVKLQKVDKVLNIRQKYHSAFIGWEPIPGLEDIKPIEQVMLPRPSITSDLSKNDGIIEILSDDDEPDNELLSSSSGRVNTKFSDARLRPDVRIKNNVVLGNISQHASDIQVIKELLGIVVPKTKLADLQTQTEFPGNNNIQINVADSNAELKKLKEHLRVFKVPLSIKNGSFNVNYKPKESKPSTELNLWNNLPVKDISPAEVTKNICKNYFVSTTISKQLTLGEFHKNNVLPTQASLITSEKITPNPPRTYFPGIAKTSKIPPSVPPAQIIITGSNSRPNPYSVNTSLTPLLSIPQPSVNYNPSRTAIPPNNPPVILNHQINSFPASTLSHTTYLNTTAAYEGSANVINPVAVQKSVPNPASYATHPLPTIRVRSVKELQ